MNISNIKNYQNFKILITVFLFWISIQFEKPIEDSIAYVLVVSIGIMHGANDLLILYLKKINRNGFLRNFIIYISIVSICALFYLLSPFLSILLFIFISSYHFGEEHLSIKASLNASFDTIYFIVYGLLIFSMLFYETLFEVNTIMLELSKNTFSELLVQITFITSFVIFVVMSLYLCWKKKIEIKEFLNEIFFLGLLFLVFKTSSLILSFAIYFIFWHSIPSIIHQIVFISGDVTKKSILFYVKKALLFWLISIVGLFVLYQFIPEVTLLSTIIFVILLSVTAPHIWVMYKMKN
ncbi:MAG: Brp/Blh family beta-carotene 15,15'-dioxygenase [Polaribacter sp.]|uniref:Brp/Blh family beta-carotene 15,15'-dioxygenase n=1 Tax=Polaribacter sp. TaxID=1920175 RepID=UPI003BAF9D3E